MVIGDGIPVSQYMKDTRVFNVKRLTGMTGVGLKVSGEGRIRPTVWINAVVRPSYA